MFAIVCAGVMCSAAAPVPVTKPPYEVVLKFDLKKSPLGDGFATVEVHNRTSKDLELRTGLSRDLLIFLDTEVRDANDKRISEEFHTKKLCSPLFLFQSIPVGTIEAGQSLLLDDVPLFQGIDEMKLVPGTYKCRVRFAYDPEKVNAVSGWQAITLTAEHLKK
jgi:hypothetical protein